MDQNEAPRLAREQTVAYFGNEHEGGKSKGALGEAIAGAMVGPIMKAASDARAKRDREWCAWWERAKEHYAINPKTYTHYNSQPR